MKLLKQWFIILFALSLALSYPRSSAAIEDAIIAVVNDELITLKDLKDYVQSTYVSLVAEGMSNDQIKEIMKDMEINGTNKLIEDKLILSKANDIGIIVREGLVDKRMEEIREKYGSEQILVEVLIKNGATLTDLRDKIRNQLKIKYIVDHEVKTKIYVNPQEVTNYYEQNNNQFTEEPHIILESIFIAYDDDKPLALKRAVEAFKYAAADNDFSNLAKKYSDSPSIGAIKRGQLLPLIEETVFNLKLNEVSHLVEVENGLYIFKLAEEKPAQISKLDDVKDAIYNLLFMEKFKGQFMIWLDNLKKDAYIEIKQ